MFKNLYLKNNLKIKDVQVKKGGEKNIEINTKDEQSKNKRSQYHKDNTTFKT